MLLMRQLFADTEFAEVGATAAKWGVKAIQVTGWHVGGQDQAYPDHSTNPRLVRHFLSIRLRLPSR